MQEKNTDRKEAEKGTRMSFEVIETQEQLDKIIGDRIARAKEAAKKEAEEEFKGKNEEYDTLKAKLKEKENHIAELGNKLEEMKNSGSGMSDELTKLKQQVQKYETDSVKTRIAREFGIDASLANRLTGETEEEIKADAKALKDIIGSTSVKRVPYNPETPAEDDKEAALKKMLQNMKGE